MGDTCNTGMAHDKMHKFQSETVKITDRLEGHVEDLGICGRLNQKVVLRVTSVRRQDSRTKAACGLFLLI
jgi:hypothetical protein